MKHALTLLLLVAVHAHALTAEDIRKLAKQPHSRDQLVDALNIYPEAREYEVTQLVGPSMEELKPLEPIKVSEKTVEGKYIVSMMDLPDKLGSVIMIVGYDEATDSYKKWVLAPDGNVYASTGVADLESRTMAWTSDLQEKGAPKIVTHEVHGDDASRWKEVTMQNGKVVWMTRGRAKKVK